MWKLRSGQVSDKKEGKLFTITMYHTPFKVMVQGSKYEEWHSTEFPPLQTLVDHLQDGRELEQAYAELFEEETPEVSGNREKPDVRNTQEIDNKNEMKEEDEDEEPEEPEAEHKAENLDDSITQVKTLHRASPKLKKTPKKKTSRRSLGKTPDKKLHTTVKHLQSELLAMQTEMQRQKERIEELLQGKLVEVDAIIRDESIKLKNEMKIHKKIIENKLSDISAEVDDHKKT